jgi:hypothetical protein
MQVVAVNGWLGFKRNSGSSLEWKIANLPFPLACKTQLVQQQKVGNHLPDGDLQANLENTGLEANQKIW